jgi:hypothetical protein
MITTKDHTGINTTPKRATFKEKVDKIFFEFEIGTRNKNPLPGFLASSHSKAYFDIRTRAALLQLIDHYPEKMVRDGVSWSIRNMILDVFETSKNKQKLSPEEIKKNLNKAAEVILKAFSNESFIILINETGSKLDQHLTDHRVILRNIAQITDRPELTKDYTYPLDEVEAKAATILDVYNNYTAYTKFFEYLGFQLPKTKLFPQSSFAEGSAFFHVSAEVYISARYTPSNKWFINFHAVHELAHRLQLKEAKPIPYGKYYGVDDTTVAKSINENKESVSVIIVESGAIFVEALYGVWSPNKDKVSAHFVLDTLDRLQLRSPNTKKWMTRIYLAMQQNQDPHKAFYNLVNKAFEKDNRIKYEVGTALAMLLYSCNQFDAKKTAIEMIKLDKPYLIIEKLYELIKADKDGRILVNVLNTLKRPE